MNISTSEARLLLDATHALRDAKGTHPALHEPAATLFMSLFRADFVAASLWDAQTGCYIEPQCFGRDHSVHASYLYYQSLDPFRGHIRARAGRATSLSRAIARPKLHCTPYYSEHLRLYGLEDGVEIALMENRQIVGDFRIWRGGSDRRMGEHEELILELIAPSVLKSLKKFGAAHQSARRLAADPAPVASARTRLSPRERQVLELLSSGDTDKLIAKKLGLSFWTVRTHVAALLHKLGARNRTEAVALGR